MGAGGLSPGHVPALAPALAASPPPRRLLIARLPCPPCRSGLGGARNPGLRSPLLAGNHPRPIHPPRSRIDSPLARPCRRSRVLRGSRRRRDTRHALRRLLHLGEPGRIPAVGWRVPVRAARQRSPAPEFPVPAKAGVIRGGGQPLRPAGIGLGD